MARGPTKIVNCQGGYLGYFSQTGEFTRCYNFSFDIFSYVLAKVTTYIN